MKPQRWTEDDMIKALAMLKEGTEYKVVMKATGVPQTALSHRAVSLGINPREIRKRKKDEAILNDWNNNVSKDDMCEKYGYSSHGALYDAIKRIKLRGYEVADRIKVRGDIHGLNGVLPLDNVTWAKPREIHEEMFVYDGKIYRDMTDYFNG